MKLIRPFILLLATWTTSYIGFAQSQKADVIIKTDNTKIYCRIIGIDASVIRYRRLNQPTILRISRVLINRIVYASGVVRVIREPIKSTPTPEPPNRATPQIPQPAPEVSGKSELDQVIADLEGNKSIKGRAVRLRTILFETGSNNVRPQSFAYLDSIALFLVKIPTVTIEIGGHTDNIGNTATNLRLSQSRANAVKDYLVSVKRIASTQLRAVGYGQTAPLATNNTAQGRALNRRMELTFLGLSNDDYTIQLKNGTRIWVTFLVSSADNKTISYRENANAALSRMPVTGVDFIEYPNGTRRPVGSTTVITRTIYSHDNQKKEEDSPRQPPALTAKKFSIQLNGLSAYMLGSEVWTSLSAGYGHTIGVGGSVQFDYWLTKQISIGLEPSYLAWSTQIDLVEAPGSIPYSSYHIKTAQGFLLAHVRVGLGNHFYLMPQGGINLLQIDIDKATGPTSFKTTQTSYGGGLGYLINPDGKANLDIGLFYRTTLKTKTMGTSVGVAPMQYVGIRLGLGFSY